MSDKLNTQSYYMTGDSSLGFSIYNALTDHPILSGVSTKEASDFFWANDPTHPGLSYLDNQTNKDHYNYDYFSNYSLDLDAWMNAAKEGYSYELTTDNYFHKEGEWDFLHSYKSDKQLEFDFSDDSNSNTNLKVVSNTDGVSVTIPKPFSIVKDESGLSIATNDNSKSFDHLPELDSDED